MTRRSLAGPALLAGIIAVIALSGFTVSQQRQISKLSDDVKNQAHTQQLEDLAGRLGQMESGFEQLEAFNSGVLLRADYTASHQVLTKRLNDLQSKIEVISSDNATTRAALLAIEATIEGLEVGLADVDKKVAAVSAKTASRVASRAKPQPVARASQPKPTPAVINPPFQVVGLESRGNEQFLAVAPHGSTRLDQIQLIRPGETLQQWRLNTIGAATVEFNFNGSQQTVSLR